MNQATPTISVIIPVFNSSHYLSKAIDSVLLQTFIDFELIIINDGSTDNSKAIIKQYNDNRIRYYENQENKGLVYTLNKGIELSNGTYIARMDGDDIALPRRFEKQISYFQAHPATAVLATQVALINEVDQLIGSWEDDLKTVSAEAIKAQLPKNNCIAHPSIMIRTALLKKYKYSTAQTQAEDYDLWLRLVAGNIPINKLKEVLVYYRILPDSFTRQRQQNVFFKNYRTKSCFVANQLRNGKLNAFVATTLVYALLDVVKGTFKILKRFIKRQ